MEVSNKKKERYKKWYEANKERVLKSKRLLMRKYRAENPEKNRQISRKAKAALRQKVLDAYGRKCTRCGFSDERALTLDHILNNGAQERKAIGERGVYLRCLKIEHRTEYQTLCMNCQFIKRVESFRQNQHG